MRLGHATFVFSLAICGCGCCEIGGRLAGEAVFGAIQYIVSPPKEPPQRAKPIRVHGRIYEICWAGLVAREGVPVELVSLASGFVVDRAQTATDGVFELRAIDNETLELRALGTGQRVSGSDAARRSFDRQLPCSSSSRDQS